MSKSPENFQPEPYPEKEKLETEPTSLEGGQIPIPEKKQLPSPEKIKKAVQNAYHRMYGTRENSLIKADGEEALNDTRNWLELSHAVKVLELGSIMIQKDPATGKSVIKTYEGRQSGKNVWSEYPDWHALSPNRPRDIWKQHLVSADDILKIKNALEAVCQRRAELMKADTPANEKFKDRIYPRQEELLELHTLIQSTQYLLHFLEEQNRKSEETDDGQN